MKKNSFAHFILIAQILLTSICIILMFLNSVSNFSNPQENISNNKGIIYSNDKSVPFTGRMLDTLDNKLIVAFDVVNGVKHGEFLLLTMEGNCAVKGFMNKNKNDGLWKYFYADGQLECSGEFDEDNPVGLWIWYYKNGIKKCQGNYFKGMPEGKWIKFDSNGYPSLIIYYSEGELVNYIQIDQPIKV